MNDSVTQDIHPAAAFIHALNRTTDLLYGNQFM